MDIRPTREKKKTKVSKKSAHEIHRIRASVRRNGDADQPVILVIPTVVPLFNQSAPVLQRKYETLLLCRDHQGSRRGYRSEDGIICRDGRSLETHISNIYDRRHLEKKSPKSQYAAN